MSKANTRYRLRIIASVLALVSLIWVASDQFGIPWKNFGWMLVYTVIAVLGIIIFAGVAAAIWQALRKLLRRNP